MNSKPLSLPAALSQTFVTYFPSAFRLIALGNESSRLATTASALSPRPAFRRFVLDHAGRSAVIVIFLADGRMDRISSVEAEDEDDKRNAVTADGTQDDAARERTD